MPDTPARLVAAARTLRRRLHQHPEPSNHEKDTAAGVAAFLADHGLRPRRRGLGGHSLYYTLSSGRPGPVRLFRADLDALPIREETTRPYRSRREGVHHACGHDGHSAMLAGAVASLHASQDFTGTVHALFQAAEETGEGARRARAGLGARARYDHVYAVHNYPGLPRGHVAARVGTAARASVGLEVRAHGRRGHASEPDRAVNPLALLARVAATLQSDPAPRDRFRGRTLTTLVGWGSEGPNYGVSPAAASVHATIRGDRERDVERRIARVQEAARRLVAGRPFRLEWVRHDPFPETVNHPRAVEAVERAAQAAGLPHARPVHPLSASEDFGHFTREWPGALVLLGAGVRHPPLHSPRYDFPDSLLADGIRLWCRLARQEAGFGHVAQRGSPRTQRSAAP